MIGLFPLTVQKYENGTVELGGLLKEVATALENHLNFSTFYSKFLPSLRNACQRQKNQNNIHPLSVQPPTASWGIPLANGSFSGMLGQLEQGQADYSPAGFMMSFERQQSFQFMHAQLYTEWILYVRNPNNEWNWVAYFTPLRVGIWLTMMLCILVLPLMIYLTVWSPPKVKKN